ncbi:MAG: hypothetical protein MO847_02040 [Candidatus Protistobacter heckmanni]|nr:hypothetical protein [Candidatus Protistobacter heckmanni]
MLLLACLLLAACSPEFDWRVIQNGEGGYAAMFPGKPGAEQRKVTMAGARLDMQMQAASAGGTLFAVGAATLPQGAAEGLRAQVLEAMKQGLLANFDDLRVSESRAQVQTAAAPQQQVDALQFAATGTARGDGQRRRVYARLMARDGHAYQVVVIEPLAAGEGDAKIKEQAEQFLAGFQPY